ncbi:hypothetical protein BA065_02695 [Nanoarchaeota archaeon NZ13-N]|uniref:Peptidase M48 domain-containing protein n=1 Tax=Candidatus Nanoclepta minutus TaxID=1940235 RepID=A0A397WMT0_9ARCH|nr:MAG: hypothetical protein BA065_02695 [Nanoarchaeota archaeon NZ13-N]RIB35394.1 MAG: hypothetical protein BXU00_01350 [Candidatus Nanoclepta minutus]
MVENLGFSSKDFFNLKSEIERKSKILLLFSIIWLTLINFLIANITYIALDEELGVSLFLMIFIYIIMTILVLTELPGIRAADLIVGIFLFLFVVIFILPIFYNILASFPFLMLFIISLLISITFVYSMSSSAEGDPGNFLASIIHARPSNLKDPKEYMAYQLFDALRIGFGLSNKVELKIVDWPIINAMTVSGSDGRSMIILTKGAIEKLDYHELENVLAHEFSHIINKDSEFMTKFAIVSAAVLVLAWFMAYVLPRIIFKRSGRGSDRDRKGEGYLFILALISLVVGLLLYIITPIIMSKLISRASKLREHLADIAAVRKTNYPPGMINALMKVAYESSEDFIRRNKIPENIQALFFDTEIETHPRVWQRIYLICETTKTPLPPQFYELKSKNI